MNTSVRIMVWLVLALPTLQSGSVVQAQSGREEGVVVETVVKGRLLMSMQSTSGNRPWEM